MRPLGTAALVDKIAQCAGALPIAISVDRASTFKLQIASKHQRGAP
ncbi:MAG: hypothetical protein K0R08_1289 [Solimicrobium sp.]|nr:hypothetical protein [Solimicrobium sp.]